MGLQSLCKKDENLAGCLLSLGGMNAEFPAFFICAKEKVNNSVHVT
jgi:hypothetical protein